MGSAYEIHVVFLKKAGHNVGTEGEGDATIVFAPARDIFVWIGPEKIAEEATIRNL